MNYDKGKILEFQRKTAIQSKYDESKETLFCRKSFERKIVKISKK